VAGFKVTLDPSKISGSDNDAIDAAHESTHINNLKDGSFTDFAGGSRLAKRRLVGMSLAPLGPERNGRNVMAALWLLPKLCPRSLKGSLV